MDLVRRLVTVAVMVIAVGAMTGGCSSPVASGPSASPRISCVGVPAARCDQAIASVARSLPNTAPVSIDVLCVSGTCTPESGAMDTVVTLADGSQLRSTTVQWAGGGGGEPPPEVPAVKPLPVPVVPIVPVEPICQGVPVSMCRTMAETAFGEITDQAVVGIVVRCSQPPCTDAHGIGDTLVTYADGSVRTSSWEYQGG